jgi:tetratricopeptide (TPR) repeat protein/O-antigen ligase
MKSKTGPPTLRPPSPTEQKRTGSSAAIHLNIWDYLVAAGIGLLALLTPFASGGVGVAATGFAEGICFSLAILWSGKLFLDVLRRGAFPNSGWDEFRVLALAAGAFLGLLILQLVPLPPTLIRALSPHAYDLYRNSLPGWPNPVVYANPSYVRVPPHQKTATVVAVLPTIDEVRRGVAVPFAQRTGGGLAQLDDATPVAFSAWRSLSVAPVLTRAGLLKCTALASLFLVVVLYLPGAEDADAERQFRRVVVLIILASGVAVAIGGLSEQAFSHGRSFVEEAGTAPRTLRASGPFVNPDHFANYLAMIVPLAVAGALFRVPFQPTQERLSGFQLLCGAAALILCAAIVVSLSRAGWFELVLGIFVFVYLLRSRRHDLRGSGVAAPSQWKSNGRSKAWGTTGWLWLAGGGLLAVALVSLVLVGAGERAQAGARAAESISRGVGFSDRVHMWIDSAGIVRDYPIFGSGFDSWSTVFPRYQRPPWTRFFSGAAQNDYVEIADEIGILGLVLLGWLCWRIGRYLIVGSHSIPVRHRALFVALVAAIPIMGFHEALDFCMQIPANAVLLVLLVALSMRLVRTHRGATKRRPRGLGAGMAVPAAVALVAMVGLLAVFFQRETVYPDDLPYPISIHDNEATILSHPGSPIPHLWLADRVHDSTGVWLVPELKAAIWLDPTNPAGRDRYVQALLVEGATHEALQQISIATNLAPSLSDHGYLNDREIPWLTEDERAAAERGLCEALASGFEGGTQGLAQLYSSEGRESMAASVYEAAAQRTPNAAEGFELSLAAATSYARAGENRKAERLLLAAINLGSDDPRPYSYLIEMVYGPERNTQAAIRTIRMAAHNGLGTAPLYLVLEDSAQKVGDSKLAEAALHEAVDADPSFSSWMRLGSFYLERGNFADASESIRRSLKINPGSGQAYFLLAQAEEGQYQYSAAQADYQRAIALAPDNSEYRDRSINLLRKIADNVGRSRPRSTAGVPE